MKKNTADTIRTFIAIELPERILSHIQKVQEGMNSYQLNCRWVPPENIHLTLKFLGDIHREEIEKIALAMTDAVKEFLPAHGAENISLSAKGIGVFPNIKRARVIWIGLRGGTRWVIELQKILENHLEKSGFPKEERPFKVHLTLARVKDRMDVENLAQAMKEFGESESDAFMADKIILFQSELKPTGAVYTKLMEAPFSAGVHQIY